MISARLAEQHQNTEARTLRAFFIDKHNNVITNLLHDGFNFSDDLWPGINW